MKIVKCDYAAKEKFEVTIREGALIKEIFRNLKLLEFCHFERYV